MSVTDIALIISIIIALLYAIYDEFIMARLQGTTQLCVYLRRSNRLDTFIFIGLIAILIYKNITTQGTPLTTFLLSFLALVAIYIAYIRHPKLLFKSQGFFYANIFIAYRRIKNINLSEDGILVIELEQRRLLINVQQLDDLEKIYNFMI
ncbi:DUF986 family protein [Pectobacteriaceae bacterium CE90]|nr:DUF986 family protein [Pectobacteriaceae bacterium CE90]